MLFRKFRDRVFSCEAPIAISAEAVIEMANDRGERFFFFVRHDSPLTIVVSPRKKPPGTQGMVDRIYLQFSRLHLILNG